jgi:tetratricopeptide (TPR) repeat protein
MKLVAIIAALAVAFCVGVVALYYMFSTTWAALGSVSLLIGFALFFLGKKKKVPHAQKAAVVFWAIAAGTMPVGFYQRAQIDAAEYRVTEAKRLVQEKRDEAKRQAKEARDATAPGLIAAAVAANCQGESANAGWANLSQALQGAQTRGLGENAYVHSGSGVYQRQGDIQKQADDEASRARSSVAECESQQRDRVMAQLKAEDEAADSADSAAPSQQAATSVAPSATGAAADAIAAATAATAAATDATQAARTAELAAAAAPPATPEAPPSMVAAVAAVTQAAASAPEEATASPATPPAAAEQSATASADATPGVGAPPCASAVECVKAMLGSARAENLPAAMEAAQTLDALPKPARGDRAMARKLNQQGLTELSSSNASQAVGTLTSATQTDPADQEILSNLAFAYSADGQQIKAEDTAVAALALNPRRTSVWAPLAITLAREHRVGQATEAMWLAYQFSGDKQKTLTFIDAKLAAETDPDVTKMLTVSSAWFRQNKKPDVL